MERYDTDKNVIKTKYEQLYNAVYEAECFNDELKKILTIIDIDKFNKLEKAKNKVVKEKK